MLHLPLCANCYYHIMGDGSITAGTFNNSQVASVIGQGSATVNTTAGKL